jgi:hypothetical protein
MVLLPLMAAQGLLAKETPEVMAISAEVGMAQVVVALAGPGQATDQTLVAQEVLALLLTLHGEQQPARVKMSAAHIITLAGEVALTKAAQAPALEGSAVVAGAGLAALRLGCLGLQIPAAGRVGVILQLHLPLPMADQAS